MPLRMWTYDLAREQAPTLDHLRRFCDLSLESGYNSIGLYLEHRFAYPSTPWSHGKDCLTPELVQILQQEYRTLQIVPFINLLGHFEGFLYTEAGAGYAELPFKGMQACPCREGFVELANRLLDDILDVFDSSIVHIGGDETQHLGACSCCAIRVAEYEKKVGVDGKARLFGDHFAPLLSKVIDAGRRPGIWGDMLHAHPQAMSLIPEATLIFDWQYFQSAGNTSQRFRNQGFDVVYCPTLHVYNATWLHLPQSERNVRENVISAHGDLAYGVCLTTWECGLFGNYETLMPAIRASGEIMERAAEFSEEAAEKSIREIQLDPEPDPPIDGPSDSEGLAEGILSALMERCASEAVLMPSPRQLTVSMRTDGSMRESGRFPVDAGKAILHRISQIAGLDSEKYTERRIGRIAGRYKKIPFSIDLASEPTAHGLKFTLTMEPWTPTTQYAAERSGETFLRAYLRESEAYEEWARLMGVELQDSGPPFEFGGIRSGIKCRLLLYSNPFLLWLRHRDELCGAVGDRALSVFERGVAFAPDASARGVSDFGKSAVQFVRFAEEAHQAYLTGSAARAATALIPCRQIFENLAKIAKSNNIRIGGSLADIERCMSARDHIERVMRRVKMYGDGSLGYLPSFEMITHPSFVPHDQAGWWLINSWARE